MTLIHMPSAAELASTLLLLARGQRSCIETDNWAEFEHLAVQRDEIQRRLNLVDSDAATEDLLAILRDTQNEDHGTIRLIEQFQSQTSNHAQQVHNNVLALQGYERLGISEDTSSALDAQG